MKKLSKLLSLLLCVVLMLVMAAACGGEGTTIYEEEWVEGGGSSNSGNNQGGNNQGGNNQGGNNQGGNNQGGSNQGGSNQGNNSQGGSTLVKNVYTSGYPIVKKQVTLSVMVKQPIASAAAFEAMPFTTEYEKKTGVKIEWQVASSGDVNQQVVAKLSGGKYPDVIMVGGSMRSSQVEKYGRSGLLLDLSSAIKEWAPNAYAMINGSQDIKDACYYKDGKLFGLPNINNAMENGHGMYPEKMYINEKWLKALNLSMPTTYDEMLSVLSKFKTGDPNKNGLKDEIPFSVAGLSTLVAGGPQGIEWKFQDNDNCYVDRNGKIGYFYTSDACRDSLNWLHKVFDAGCLDWPAFTRTQTVAKSVSTGLVGAFVDFTGCMDLPESSALDYVAVPPLKANANSTPTVLTSRKSTYTPNAMMITSSAKKDQKMEIALRWIDYFYTKEGSFFKEYGPSGGFHTANGDGTYTIKSKVQNGKTVLMDDTDRYQYAPGWVITGLTTKVDDMWKSNTTIVLKNTDKFYNTQDNGAIPRIYSQYKNPLYIGHLQLSSAMDSKLAGYKSTLHAYAEQCMGRFVSGDMNIDTEWNDYLTKMKKYGSEDLVAIYQKAYNK